MTRISTRHSRRRISAVFVWSMYLAFGPDGYIRYGLDDPMAALASRLGQFQ